MYRQRGKADGVWSQPSMVLSDTLGVADLQLAIDDDGQFHATWSKRVIADNWDVFYQRLSARLVLPVMLKAA
jgi:hypothetical protein